MDMHEFTAKNSWAKKGLGLRMVRMHEIKNSEMQRCSILTSLLPISNNIKYAPAQRCRSEYSDETSVGYSFPSFPHKKAMKAAELRIFQCYVRAQGCSSVRYRNQVRILVRPG
jgi:hypothetical protein